MSGEIRGSDKLKQTCSSLTELNPEEMKQIAGGYFSYPLVSFPHGIPWTEFFRNNLIDNSFVNHTNISTQF